MTFGAFLLAAEQGKIFAGSIEFPLYLWDVRAERD